MSTRSNEHALPADAALPENPSRRTGLKTLGAGLLGAVAGSRTVFAQGAALSPVVLRIESPCGRAS